MKKYEVVGSDGKVILETDDGSEAYALKNKKNAGLRYNMRSLFVRKNLSIHATSISSEVSAYRFWFEGGGYAFYYVDEETGVFQIFSDWGNYAYCWPHQCRSKGEGLLAFFKTADKYYLTDKLTMGTERREFNLSKTLSDIKHLICEKRRQRKMSRVAAHILWMLVSESRHCDTDRELFDRLTENEDFTTFIEEDVSELFVYELPDSLMFLRESLIPFFKKYIEDVTNDRAKD